MKEDTMDEQSSYLYFAYGSNMSSRRLNHQSRAPTAARFIAATAQGYRLVFDKVSKDGSSKADCEYTGNPAHQVCGGLYRVPFSEAVALDRVEGATGSNPGYQRTEIALTTAQGPVKAITYVARHKLAGLKPYSWYRRHVLVGAQEFNLPLPYIEAIERLETQEDANKAREAEELAIYQDASTTGQTVTQFARLPGR